MEFEQMTAPVSDTTESDKALAIAELTGTTESIPEIKQETPEPIAKAKEEPKEETPKAEPKTKTEDEIRKEVEREMKHKYLSQVSIKSREADEAKAKLAELEQERDEKKYLYDNGEATAEDYIESMVEAKLQKQEISKQERKINELNDYEKQDFISKNADAKTYLSKLDEIKNDNPNLSWHAVNTLYLALNNPESLVKNTTRLDL